MQTLPTIQITTGRHAGASLTPTRPEIVLGSDPGCDLVLSDPGLASRHARLRASPSGVVVTALDAPVEAVGLGTIEPGFESPLPPGVEIEAGGVRLGLGNAATAATTPAVARRGVIVAAALFGVLLISLPAQFAGSWEDHRPPPPPSEVAAVAVEEPPPTAPVEARAPIDALRAQLAEAEFGHLTLSHSGEAVVVTGRVPEDDAVRLDEVLAWFDQQHPRVVLLTDNLEIGGPPPPPPEPPAIQSVWQFGPDPWIVVGDASIRVGEVAPGGWALEAIEAGHALFTHEGRRWRVHYGLKSAQP